MKEAGSNKEYTSNDVARLAGVSQTTVSRVLCGNKKVSDQSRRKVLEAIETLNYRPNAFARGLSTRKTKMIGIIIRNFRNPFYPDVLSQFYARLSEMNYHLLFINSETEEIQENEINQLTDFGVQGVILTDALLSSPAAARLLRRNIPVVLFNRFVENSGSSAVCCDNYAAGRQIATFLVGHGHTTFAFISGSPDTSTSKDRKKGFEDVLFERGISAPLVLEGDYTFNGGFRAAQEILSQKEKTDCIFCANDIMAIGAMDAIRIMGLRIPEDISIVGFDDVDMAGWPSYQLTTWQQPVSKMVESAIELLLNEMKGSGTTPQTITIKGALIVRNSVAIKARISEAAGPVNK